MVEDFDKPFKDYDELIELMKKRNIVITDINFVKECLSDISYYSIINGYKDLFPNDGDTFTIPIRFEDLFALYLLDTNINNILFKYIINIEKSLKSKISYIISKKYGVYTDINDISNNNENDYLCKNNFKASNYRDNTLRLIKEEIKTKTTETDIAHYLNNHNHLPCWILINSIPFGLTIRLFKIMKSDDKTYVSDLLIQSDISIDDKKRFLFASLNILKAYRNKIAHGKKFFTNSITNETPKRLVLKLSKGQITKRDYINGIGKNDLFAVILIIMNVTRGYTREMFINEITSYLSSLSNNIYSGKTLLELLNLPQNFLIRLENMK